MIDSFDPVCTYIHLKKCGNRIWDTEYYFDNACSIQYYGKVVIRKMNDNKMPYVLKFQYSLIMSELELCRKWWRI